MSKSYSSSSGLDMHGLQIKSAMSLLLPLYSKHVLLIVDLQTLNEKLNTSSKPAYYRNFDTLLDVDLYLTIDLSYLYKRTLSKFRGSGHCLDIETANLTENLDIVSTVQVRVHIPWKWNCICCYVHYT